MSGVSVNCSACTLIRVHLGHLPPRPSALDVTRDAINGGWTVNLKPLGRARRVVVTRDTTTIVDGAGDPQAIQGRIAQIRREIEATDSDFDREKLQERLAALEEPLR